MSAQHVDGQFEFFDQVVLTRLLASQRSKLRPSTTYVLGVLRPSAHGCLFTTHYNTNKYDQIASLQLCLGGNHT